MIQIISGVKGKGKTKFLIQKANEAVKAANGSVVYLDKNNKHMYELSNRIRLINVGDFPIDTYDAFLGFICGLISQDNDLEHMFFDSFLTIASVSEDYVGYVLSKLSDISEKFHVDFTISVSIDADSIPEEFKKDCYFIIENIIIFTTKSSRGIEVWSAAFSMSSCDRDN